jgi:hypothetical protein
MHFCSNELDENTRAHPDQRVTITQNGKVEAIAVERYELRFKTQALEDRLYESHGTREAGRLSLSRCHPNRVQARELLHRIRAGRRA